MHVTHTQDKSFQGTRKTCKVETQPKRGTNLSITFRVRCRQRYPKSAPQIARTKPKTAIDKAADIEIFRLRVSIAHSNHKQLTNLKAISLSTSKFHIQANRAFSTEDVQPETSKKDVRSFHLVGTNILNSETNNKTISNTSAKNRDRKKTHH